MVDELIVSNGDLMQFSTNIIVLLSEGEGKGAKKAKKGCMAPYYTDPQFERKGDEALTQNFFGLLFFFANFICVQPISCHF